MHQYGACRNGMVHSIGAKDDQERGTASAQQSTTAGDA